jgi:hypothetical protein
MLRSCVFSRGEQGEEQLLRSLAPFRRLARFFGGKKQTVRSKLSDREYASTAQRPRREYQPRSLRGAFGREYAAELREGAGTPEAPVFPAPSLRLPPSPLPSLFPVPCFFPPTCRVRRGIWPAPAKRPRSAREAPTLAEIG